MNNRCHQDHHPSDHTERGTDRNLLKSRLKFAFLLSLGLIFIEGIGGWYSGSLSLLADSAHVLADAASVGMVLVTSWLAEVPRTSRRSFGYYRLEILSALFNGCLLIFTTFFIVRSALSRWQNPVEIRPTEMLVISVVGLVVNLAMLRLLHSKDGHHHLNLRSAYLHILGDTLSSVAVVVGAIVIYFTGTPRVDVVVSLLVALMIVAMSSRLIYDSIHVLLEGTPRHLDPDEIQKVILSRFPKVSRIHDFHIWEITSHLPAMTAHLEARIGSLAESQTLISDINEMLKQTYGIRHTTFQIEAE